MQIVCQPLLCCLLVFLTQPLVGKIQEDRQLMLVNESFDSFHDLVTPQQGHRAAIDLANDDSWSEDEESLEIVPGFADPNRESNIQLSQRMTPSSQNRYNP